MVENTFLVGKTQWSKWNDAGREAYNKMRRLGFTVETAIAEANAVTAKAEAARKAVKQWEDIMPTPEDEEKPVSTPKKPRAAKKST